MSMKAKTKLFENEEKIETFEKKLNNDFIDITNTNKKDMNLETLFEELNLSLVKTAPLTVPLLLFVAQEIGDTTSGASTCQVP